MELDIYSIQGSRWHFSKNSFSPEESVFSFPSDSLFAAMVASAAQLWTKTVFDQWMDPFISGTPPFILTSAFPRAGKVRFFPAPLFRGERTEKKERPAFSLKQLKKAAWLSEDIFREALSGKSLVDILMDGHTVSLQSGIFLISKDELSRLPEDVRREEKICLSEKIPHVTLDRENNASTLFFTGQTTFNNDCGLWFGLQWKNYSDEIQDRVDELTNEFSLFGLGGERNRGLGQSEITADVSLSFPEAESAQMKVLLSRWLPKPEETACLVENRSAYTLENVGGWLSSAGAPAQRRKNIVMVREGSVIEAGNLSGMMADVQPSYKGERPVQHPVWRSGYAAAVSMKGA